MNPNRFVFMLALAIQLAIPSIRLLAASTPVMEIDADDPRQVVEGFGASTAWLADDMQRLAPDSYRTVNEILWGDAPGGIGLNIHRIRVVTKISQSPQQPFDWDDETFLRDVATIKDIQDRYNPTLLAVPWTPPAWMKDTGEWKQGGRLKPEHYRDYAEWLAEYLLTLRDRFGIDVDIFSVQNEPGKKPWESCEWTTNELASFVRDHLKPVFEERGLDPQIMLNEETNWQTGMLNPLLADPVIGDWVDIAAAHFYWGSHKHPRPFVKAEELGKRVWMTEFMLENHLYPKGQPPSPLERAVHNAMVMRDAFVEARVNAYLFWWAICQPPKSIQSILQADFDSASEEIDVFSTQPVAHTLANYARFVQPGDRVLLVHDEIPDESFAGVAFVAPEKKRLAAILVNRSDQPVERSLRLHNMDAESLFPFLTDAGNEVAPLPPIKRAADGSFQISLPPVSVLTLSYPAAGRTP